LENGQISEGARVEAIDLVLASVALGDFSVFNQGTPYLTQLHDDLNAILDAALTELGDASSVTPLVIDNILARLVPALGPRGQRATPIIAFFLDPVSIDIEDIEEMETIDYDLGDPEILITDDDCAIDVGGSVEIVLCATTDDAVFNLMVGDVPESARGAVVVITQENETVQSITDDLRNDVTEFQFEI
jgi:hypothetical protein